MIIPDLHKLNCTSFQTESPSPATLTATTRRLLCSSDYHRDRYTFRRLTLTLRPINEPETTCSSVKGIALMHKDYPDGGWCYMFRLAPTRVCAHHTGKKFNYPIYRSVVEKVMRKML